MANESGMSGALQENLLTLICFDEKNIPLLSNAIEVGMFENDFFKEIAKVAFDFYRLYKEPPKEHIADLLESKLTDSKNKKTAEIYQRIITNLFHSKENINSTYIINQLTDFTRKQKLKAAIMEAVAAVKEDDLDNAEKVLNSALKNQIHVFDRGISFTNPEQSLSFFHEEINAFPTGIKHLDDENIGPGRGELLVILAPPNRGKTQFLTLIGKACCLSRLKVLHISLEMKDVRMAKRYMQAFFSLATKKKPINVSRFQHDEQHKMQSFQVESFDRPTFNDPNIESQLRKKLSKLDKRIQLEIKQFPTSALTIEGLEVYLDSMERLHNFIPDVILLDYADLMRLDFKNLRTSTGEIYKELRRIAVERNCAMVTASQSNRLGEDARVLTLKHLAEDYSKAATADTILAYSQTSQEQSLGLARLFVAKSRNEERSQTILISQAYQIGQFCMDSTRINDRYWALLGQQSPEDQSESSESTENTESPQRKFMNFRRRGTT